MAKRRRQDSSRASRLATNSSKGIGRLRLHNPPGERKSGMPHSVDIPAPVKGTMIDAAAIISPSCSTPLRMSETITADSPRVLRSQIQYGCTDDRFEVGGLLPLRAAFTAENDRASQPLASLSTITIWQRHIPIHASISNANDSGIRISKGWA